MELIETTLTAVQQRAGALLVSWTDLATQQRRRGEQVRVLAPGDDVMLQVDGDVVHRGRVLRYVGTGADGAYLVLFGAPLSRRAPVGHSPRIQDVEVRVVPAQRHRRVNLYL